MGVRLPGQRDNIPGKDKIATIQNHVSSHRQAWLGRNTFHDSQEFSGESGQFLITTIPTAKVSPTKSAASRFLLAVLRK